MKKDELFELLEEKIKKINKRPTKVAINGVDGSGKTYFSKELYDYLKNAGRQIILATIDNFHNPKEIRYQQGINSPLGYYQDSFNKEELTKRLLIPLSPNGSLRYQDSYFNHLNNSLTNSEFKVADKDAILIFEGIFLFTHELNNYWDYRIFLDVPFETILKRVQHRLKDQEYLGIENIVDKYKTRYIPGQEIYLKKDRPKEKADIVIDNTDYNNPRVKLN